MEPFSGFFAWTVFRAFGLFLWLCVRRAKRVRRHPVCVGAHNNMHMYAGPLGVRCHHRQPFGYHMKPSDAAGGSTRNERTTGRNGRHTSHPPRNHSHSMQNLDMDAFRVRCAIPIQRNARNMFGMLSIGCAHIHIPPHPPPQIFAQRHHRRRTESTINMISIFGLTIRIGLSLDDNPVGAVMRE